MSVRYASPEVIDGARQDLASDVWAWACLLLKARQRFRIVFPLPYPAFQIIADTDPYHETTDIACIKRIIQGIPPANISTSNIPPDLHEILERCWNQDPSSRPNIKQCIAVLKSSLQEINAAIARAIESYGGTFDPQLAPTLGYHPRQTWSSTAIEWEPHIGPSHYRSSSWGESGPAPSAIKAPAPGPVQIRRVSVPNNLIGCIIGKRGATINEIRATSGCNIRILDSSGSSPTERLIVLVGQPNQIQTAVQLLYDVSSWWCTGVGGSD